MIQNLAICISLIAFAIPSASCTKKPEATPQAPAQVSSAPAETVEDHLPESALEEIDNSPNTCRFRMGEMKLPNGQTMDEFYKTHPEECDDICRINEKKSEK